ncbi:MAG: rhodanese-like domain-containing protein [Bacteroidia bacterium]
MDISVKELNDRIDNGNVPVMIGCERTSRMGARQTLDIENLQILQFKLPELEYLKDKEVVMICRSGGRSGRATEYMRSMGFSKVRNLTGGMLAWKAEIDPTFDVE